MGRVFSHNYNGLVIRVPYQSIQEYNQYLVQVTAALGYDHLLQGRLFQNTPVSTYLDDWFTTNKNLYLNTEEHTSKYKEVASELVKQYILLEDANEESKQKTLTNISPIIGQIKEITEQLVTVSALDKVSTPSAIRQSKI